jgi:diguanylate cyclase (GGDEF)-like protein
MSSSDTPRPQRGTDAGPPTQQRHIEFRELLERILPLHELPEVERSRVQSALRGGVRTELEQAAMLALRALERRGTLERLGGGEGGAVRWRRRDGLDVITVELPGQVEERGVRIVPRATLPTEAPAGLDQLRRLLRLDDALLVADPGSGQARLTLIEQLAEVGRAFLGARELRFVGDEGPTAPLDAALAARARQDADRLFYCPDLAQAPDLAGLGRRDVRAVVFAAVVGGSGSPIGHLEVISDLADPFDAESLALVALLADACGGALERAARIEKLMFVDELTLVYKRSYFERQVENEMARARRDGTSMAVAIADIDNFKNFNSRYGLQAGNQVLVQVANGLRQALRPFDTVARWGGDEFAMVLTSPLNEEDAGAICERLRATVERHAVTLESLEREAHDVHVTLSIGVAMYPDHADSASELWRAANRAHNEAKRPPKNQVVFFKPR